MQTLANRAVGGAEDELLACLTAALWMAESEGLSGVGALHGKALGNMTIGHLALAIAFFVATAPERAVHFLSPCTMSCDHDQSRQTLIVLESCDQAYGTWHVAGYDKACA